MNYNSLLNLGLLQKIGTFFDIIPKVIYFVFAAISSGVDAMQALVRKLAGLDVYYDAGGNPVEGQDPLTEFLYGILGFGDSAPAYEALNTVFWSLAIFGVIILVISTIVAIIKSHYNEDTAGTSPWKYIYTSLKAIFTFVVIPVAVIVGMQLTSFLLRTIDQITAGAGSSGEVEEMYGRDVAELFSSDIAVGSTTETYAHYDYFGSRGTSSTTTFGGMLFNASLYSANRVRTGAIDETTIGNVRHGAHFEGLEVEIPIIGITVGGGSWVGGTQIFGNSEVVDGIESEEDRIEYIASQVDYAFANCLSFDDGLSYSQLKDQIGDAAPVWALSDIFGIGKTSVDAFSKWDVSTVWLFYNLWAFNFIIAFIGGFTVFAIMISIIVGLMTRLIKGAALFLIYPSILGLAPMDNFKAFKSWGSNFMQQIFMAIGAIVGMNILLLLLPYVQSLKFFGVAVIDYIVNLIILVAGLLMAKDFITMVSGFIGGADANSIGQSMKGDIAANIKKGAGMGLKAGKLGVGVMAGTVKAEYALGKKAFGAGKTLYKAAGTGSAAWRANRQAKKQNKMGHKIHDTESKISGVNKGIKSITNSFESKYGSEILKEQFTAGGKAKKEAYQKAKSEGKTTQEAFKLAKEAEDKAIKGAYDSLFNKFLKETGKDKEFAKLQKQRSGYVDGLSKTKNKYERAKTRQSEISSKYELNHDMYGYHKTTMTGSKVIHDAWEKNKDEFKGIKLTQDVKDEKGNVIKAGATVGDLFKSETWSGLGKKLGTELQESTSWRNIGKSIADSFKKTLDEGAAGLGIDKAVKGATEIFKSMKMDKPAPKGDDLVKAQGDKREAEAKAMAQRQEKTNELLSQLIDEQKKKGGSGGSGGSTT